MISTPHAGRALLLALGFFIVLVGCADKELVSGASARAATHADPTTRALRSKIDTIVVIYAENRAFDNLFGNFPGAHGLSDVVDRDGRPRPAYLPQIDRDGSVLTTL